MHSQPKIRTISNASSQEENTRHNFYEIFTRCPIPQDELLGNLGLFLNRQTLSRILFMQELYQRIIL